MRWMSWIEKCLKNHCPICRNLVSECSIKNGRHNIEQNDTNKNGVSLIINCFDFVVYNLRKFILLNVIQLNFILPNGILPNGILLQVMIMTVILKIVILMTVILQFVILMTVILQFVILINAILMNVILINGRNLRIFLIKLECLSLACLSSLVLCLRVRPEPTWGEHSLWCSWPYPQG